MAKTRTNLGRIASLYKHARRLFNREAERRGIPPAYLSRRREQLIRAAFVEFVLSGRIGRILEAFKSDYENEKAHRAALWAGCESPPSISGGHATSLEGKTGTTLTPVKVSVKRNGKQDT